MDCKQKMGCQALLFGSEPAGHYWRPLAYYLEARNYSYKLVNSFTVKRYREGMDLALNKNGCSDADTIADMLRSGRFMQTVFLTESILSCGAATATIVASEPN